jgi:hypothetical protein
MLMSILQDVGTYTGRAYENPTPLGARKLCSSVESMLISILQVVGTYTGRAYENPTPLGAKVMQFGHRHAHEHISRCWFIYGAC